MPSAIYNLIRQAILDKRCISADYNGYSRQMSPHVIGLSKTGQEQVLCYQYAGESSSELMPSGHAKNWRCLPVSGLSNVAVIDGDWQSAPNHSQEQKCVAEIDVEVAY